MDVLIVGLGFDMFGDNMFVWMFLHRARRPKFGDKPRQTAWALVREASAVLWAELRLMKSRRSELWAKKAGGSKPQLKITKQNRDKLTQWDLFT